MKNLTNRWVRPAEDRQIIPRCSRVHLTRTFVETCDERCPIAGIWSCLDKDATADDPELARPASWRLRLERAFSFRPGILFAPKGAVVQ
jgi:hypothetical protein